MFCGFQGASKGTWRGNLRESEARDGRDVVGGLCFFVGVPKVKKPPACLQQKPIQPLSVYTSDYALARQMLLLSESEPQVVILLAV